MIPRLAFRAHKLQSMEINSFFYLFFVWHFKSLQRVWIRHKNSTLWMDKNFPWSNHILHMIKVTFSKSTTKSKISYAIKRYPCGHLGSLVRICVKWICLCSMKIYRVAVFYINFTMLHHFVQEIGFDFDNAVIMYKLTVYILVVKILHYL